MMEPAAERPRAEGVEEGQRRGSKPWGQQETQPALSSQSPSPSVRAESSILRRAQLSNRSLGRSSRYSGNWAMGTDTARLSIGFGSTRRKGLKELLLQSSQVKATWLGASPRGATAGDRPSCVVDGRQEQGRPLEVNAEELSLTLDPLEHEWMLTIAHGDVASILDLLAKDLTLLSRRDFVTGFTVLHWLAKHGRHEALIEVIAFAERHHCPVDVNVFTANGRLTPLHLAALQGHAMVIKVLVGAFGANTSLRDHNGHKAWQCLRADAPQELKELLGACEEDFLGVRNTNNNNGGPSRQGGLGAFTGESKSGRGVGQTQRPTTRFSYLRNKLRQAIAFFQER
ncbi:ankyrin repeat domain-containing protein SOWAHD [Hemicordylus capensis]|uniref:ankyrin repeat domain-containing protein SOWAHD n=1 Tax=Hemicordylus capensis TaxID=884348 RepID=UPI0023026457|nr:ankyrin repeat domain-containing protein SOWAHD [Hemicordylus capensis]